MEDHHRTGLIDIHGAMWRWETLDPERESPAGEDDGIFVTFRTSGDPGREMRCVFRSPEALPPSDEQLRRLFEEAWAVEP